MDCRTALEILEVARPDTDDLSQPELAGAAAHLDAHPDCREEFQRRQQLDREIGRAMRDVPLPSGLKERLLAALAERERPAEERPADAETAPQQPSTAPPTAAKKPWRRRAVLQAVAGVAACAAAVFAAILLLPPGVQSFSVAGLPADVAAAVSAEDFDFAKLAAFEREFASELPVEWETSRLSVAGPRLYRPDEKAAPTAALYQFRFANRGGPVTGYLLVMPARQVREADQLGSLGTAATTYPTSQMTARTWKDGELVYVVVVPSGDRVNMDVLLRLLTPQTA